MAITVNVNGVPIQYPQTGDPNWGENATNFAIQTSAALGKIGLSSGTSVDITQTLDVTGNTTLDANLSVGGNASVTGNTTLTGNLTVNGNTQLGNANTDTIGVTGIVNVDSGVLYVDPVNNRVGINDTIPSVALDVTGDISASGNLSVNGNTTLGNASGDSLTINSNGVSIPNGLNFDSNTLVIDALNNRIGIGRSNPVVPLDIQADGGAFGVNIRGRASDNIGLFRFSNSVGTMRHQLGLWNDDSLNYTNASSTSIFNISQTGQLSAVVPGGSTLYPGFLCRAWVNFDGTGTFSPNPSTTKIRASGNVSSITDNGTGDYTVNFATPMPDVNYCVSLAANGTTSSDPIAWIAGLSSPTLMSISALRINTGSSAIGTLLDANNVHVKIHR